jgi:hypothetical protein
MYAAGSGLVLLTAGGSYVWYASSDNETQPLQVADQPLRPIVPIPPDADSPAVAAVEPVEAPIEQTGLVAVSSESGTNTGASQQPGSDALSPVAAKLSRKTALPRRPADKLASRTPADLAASTAKPLHIEPQSGSGSTDALLNRAYTAYRNGQLEDANRDRKSVV